jgi:hypothetical protein
MHRAHDPPDPAGLDPTRMICRPWKPSGRSMRPPRRPPRAVRVSSAVSRSAGHSTILCVGNRLFHAHALKLTTLLSCSDGDVAEQGKGEVRGRTRAASSRTHAGPSLAPERTSSTDGPFFFWKASERSVQSKTAHQQTRPSEWTDRPNRQTEAGVTAARGCSPAPVLARAPR